MSESVPDLSQCGDQLDMSTGGFEDDTSDTWCARPAGHESDHVTLWNTTLDGRLWRYQWRPPAVD